MKTTLGVIFSSRDFFPAHLVTQARKDVMKVLEEVGIEGIMLDEDIAIHGAVQTYQHSRMCADLFQKTSRRNSRHIGYSPQFWG